MKNQFIWLFSLILFAPNLFSQLKKDSSSYKNEIGIDLIPAFKIFSEPRFYENISNTLQYKRRISKSFYVRASFSYAARKTIYNSIPYNAGPHDTLNWAIEYYQTLYKPEYHSRIGGEYRWGSRRLKYFTGMDIGYYFSSFVINKHQGLLPLTYYQIDPSAVTHDTITSTKTYTEKDFTVTPFFGIQFHFSKRFFFSAQVGTPVMINFFKTGNVTSTNTSSNGFLINNFLICYRF